MYFNIKKVIIITPDLSEPKQTLIQNVQADIVFSYENTVYTCYLFKYILVPQ